MKIGLHLSMLCKNWTDDTSVYLEELKKEGFQGVEISLYGTTPDRLTKVFSKANSLGLNIFCGTGVDGEHDPSSEEPNIRKNALQYLKNCIDIAAQGNACAINGVLYAPWQAFSDIPKEKRWENSAQVLREAAEYGAEKGIDLHVEVINRFESDFMNTLEEGAAFLEKVNHAHVKLLVDTFHMNIEEDNIPEAIRLAGRKLGHLHVGESNRKLPGMGSLPWRDIGRALRDIGYEKGVVMEPFLLQGGEVARDCKVWRDLSGNADEIMLDRYIKESLTFLKHEFTF